MTINNPELDKEPSKQSTEKTTTLFKWRIIEVIEKDIDWRKFEIARRSPWVRIIIRDWNNILLTKEYRHEHNGYDYRLPGGKVFDTLEEFNEKIKDNENINTYAEKAAITECKQETWLIPVELKYITTSKAGATIERDLYYFLVNSFENNEWWQELEDGENITTERKSLEEVKKLCIDWSIKEDRSVWILLKYILVQ